MSRASISASSFLDIEAEEDEGDYRSIDEEDDNDLRALWIGWSDYVLTEKSRRLLRRRGAWIRWCKHGMRVYRLLPRKLKPLFRKMPVYHSSHRVSSPSYSILNQVLIIVSALLAGECTLVDVIVHELTHSWSGNRIMYVCIQWFIGASRIVHSCFLRQGTPGCLEGVQRPTRYQRLFIEFEKGEDPDEAYSSVPYE